MRVSCTLNSSRATFLLALALALAPALLAYAALLPAPLALSNPSRNQIAASIGDFIIATTSDGTVDVLDLSSWPSISKRPLALRLQIARDHMAASVSQNTVIFAGGWPSLSEADAVDLTNPSNITIRPLAPLLFGTNFEGCAAVTGGEFSDNAYFGAGLRGSFPGSESSRIESYQAPDFASKALDIDLFNFARSRFVSGTVNFNTGMTYWAGGTNGPNSTYVTSIEIYDRGANTWAWRALPARKGGCTAVLGDFAYLIGGLPSDQGNVIFEYDVPRYLVNQAIVLPINFSDCSAASLGPLIYVAIWETPTVLGIDTRNGSFFYPEPLKRPLKSLAYASNRRAAFFLGGFDSSTNISSIDIYAYVCGNNILEPGEICEISDHTCNVTCNGCLFGSSCGDCLTNPQNFSSSCTLSSQTITVNIPLIQQGNLSIRNGASVTVSSILNVNGSLIVEASGSLNLTQVGLIDILGDLVLTTDSSLTIDASGIDLNATAIIVGGCSDFAGNLILTLDPALFSDSNSIFIPIASYSCYRNGFQSVKILSNNPCETLLGTPDYRPSQLDIVVSIARDTCDGNSLFQKSSRIFLGLLFSVVLESIFFLPRLRARI